MGAPSDEVAGGERSVRTRRGNRMGGDGDSAVKNADGRARGPALNGRARGGGC